MKKQADFIRLKVFLQIDIFCPVSSRSNYEVSSELLDNIIEKSESLNILGGRLTGAGFGGCCIFLINQNDTEQIFDTLSSHFSGIKFVDVI